jgi:hypothetical protein
MLKKLLFSLFILFVAASALYLIPNFDYTYQDKKYVFSNLPSLWDNNKKDLNISIPLLTPTYVYKVESANKIESENDWNNLASKDQKILEQRLQSLMGNNFEIRLDKIDDKIVYTVYTNQRIPKVDILSTTNSSFLIKAVKDYDLETQQPSSFEDLNLSRSDYGYAEIVATTVQSEESPTGAAPAYDIRLPLSYSISAEKVDLMKSKALQTQLSLEVASTNYQGYFNANSTGVPTHLVISGITNPDEALYVKALLNTSPYNELYLFLSTDRVDYSVNKLYAFIGIIIGILALAIAINIWKVKNLSLKKALMIVAIVIIYTALFKLLSLTISLPAIFLMLSFVLFSIYNTKFIYYASLIGVLFLIKLLGYLNGFDISAAGLIITALFGLLMYLTNYMSYDKQTN